MLFRTGDFDCNIDLRLYRSAGLADLFGVGTPAGIYYRPGRANGRAKLVCESFHESSKAFGATDATIARDSDFCIGERDSLCLLRYAGRYGDAAFGKNQVYVILLGSGGIRRCDREGSRLHCYDDNGRRSCNLLGDAS